MGSLRRQRFGWYAYDWANSAFFATVVTVFFGPYLTSVAKAAAGPDGMVRPFDLISLHPGSIYAFAASIAVVAQVIILPMVGAVADSTPFRRRLLGIFALSGAAATTLMFFLSVETANYLYGVFLFIVANLFFGASVVVYNAFLPELATPKEADTVSSRGWAWGYLGGGLLLLANLLYFTSAKESGTVDIAVRTILASAGIWWALFTILPLRLLPKESRRVVPSTMSGAFRQLITTLRHIRGYPMTLRFLIAYLLYNDAVQTVILMASTYGEQELGLGLDVLTQAILLVQFVAVGGSLLFDRIARRIGTRHAIAVAIVGWMMIVLAAWLVVDSAQGFFILAAAIAVVLGGIQALSRSLFSQMIPRGKEAEYFSLYEISDKGTSWLGTAFFGLAVTMTGSFRIAIASLVVFFVVGLILLVRVDVNRARADAAEQ